MRAQRAAADLVNRWGLLKKSDSGTPRLLNLRERRSYLKAKLPFFNTPGPFFGVRENGRVDATGVGHECESFSDYAGQQTNNLAPIMVRFSLLVRVQGVEATMGRSKSRRVVRLAADDLDVAR